MKKNQNIIDQDRSFYQVKSSTDDAPLRDYLLHGYESRQEFYLAVRKIVLRWRGRIGERIDEKHGFFLLRFHDTPGGKPDEEWIPKYLLIADNDYARNHIPPVAHQNKLYDVLDDIFGF